MASLLSTKQISSLLKTKRRQFVESAVGLGSAQVTPPTTRERAVTKPRDTVVLVFNIKTLPNRAALSARKTFHDSELKLRKVPNGVVKAAARHTPFEHMMTGPTMIATPLPGKTFTFSEIIEVAKTLRSNAKLSGLLFTGLVHANLFLTPKRLDELDVSEVNKIPSLVAQPAVRMIQMMNYARIPTLATLLAYNEKRAKEGAVSATGQVAAAK
jgi:ribosomal protein L10